MAPFCLGREECSEQTVLTHWTGKDTHAQDILSAFPWQILDN